MVGIDALLEHDLDRARCARRVRAGRRSRFGGAARARGGSPSRPSSSSARRLGRCAASPRRLRGARTPPPPTPTRPSPRAAGRSPAKVRDCPGWKNARFRIHESRGRIHVTSSGSVPRSSNQQMASNAVLPPPTITYPAAGVRERGELADRDAADPVGHGERRRDRSPAPATPCTSRRRRGGAPSRRSPDRSPGSGSAGRPGSRTSGRSAPVPTPGSGDA